MKRDKRKALGSEKQVVRQMIQRMGDNPYREGLLDTPDRVINSWEEMFCGYSQKVEDLITTFEQPEGYDQIIIAKNIEFFSFCEHHLLPFHGKAHVAYLPGKRVLGVSKLARLVDMYARRLQIQERIGQQVVQALSQHAEARGAACIIEAKHLCMACRGVGKQHSTMVTSSLEGVFLDDPSVRSELLSLISLPIGG